ncbi:MAG: leucine-rich repeat domain-containing protein [Clostridiaceae bacterium]|nr:leucine-rich repeat domain-containing protein [Clostridiaceae bacterium]
MFCPMCGFDLGDQVLNYCKNCGNPLKEDISAQPIRQQIYAEQHRPKPNIRKRSRLLAILIPVLVLVLAAGIYLIFFSGLPGEKVDLKMQGKLFFEPFKKEYKEKDIESQNPTGYFYNIFTDGTIEIADFTIYKENLQIPQKIDGLLVTGIGNEAFAYCDHLSSVTIPDSVISLGNEAFYECGYLSTVEIPDSVMSIGNKAFWECSSLSKITIPESVKYIGSTVFYGCTVLKKAIVPYQLEYCGSQIFPDYTEIQDHAGQKRPLYAQKGDFMYTLLNQPYTGLVRYNGTDKKPHIPETIDEKQVIYLEDTFIFNQDITDVIIPNSVISVGYVTFFDCNYLERIIIPDSVTSIGDWTFTGCSMLKDIIIPDSVTNIGEMAFSDCTALERIVIPDSVTSISYWTFGGCTSLEEIIIPDSVTSIDKRAFYDCSSLREISIPESVKYIGEYSFLDCNSLEQIYFDGSRKQWQTLTEGVYLGTDAEVVFGK